MKFRPIIFSLVAVALAACDNKAARDAEEQRKQLEQREAAVRDAELGLEQRKLADQQAALDADRQKLEQERAAAQEDATKLARVREDEQRLRQREQTLRAEEQRSKDRAREKENEQRRAAEQEQASQRAEQDRKLDLFYSALDPLGDWLEVEPYGYVWQPRLAQSAAWRPYTDGSWAYTDYGWTWKSEEPFGWATYHYGRWARVRRVGWVWVPGSEWAPAWVAWRRGSDYVGWAPLPPEAHAARFDAAVDSYFDIGPASYVFVPVTRLGETSYRTAIVPPERNVTIVNNTVNITRINYTTVQNKTVIFNGGPDLAQVNSASQRPVPRLSLQRVAQLPAPGAGGTSVVGNVLRIVAPPIAAAPRAATAPATVKQKVKAPEVEHGWDVGNAAELQSFRERQRREATEAEQEARKAPVKPQGTIKVPPRPTPPLPQPPAPAPRPVATPNVPPRVPAAPATPSKATPATPRPKPPGLPPATPTAPPPEVPSATPVATPAATPRRRPGAPASATPPAAPDAAPAESIPRATPLRRLPPAQAVPGAPTATPTIPARPKGLPPGAPRATVPPAPGVRLSTPPARGPITPPAARGTPPALKPFAPGSTPPTDATPPGATPAPRKGGAPARPQ